MFERFNPYDLDHVAEIDKFRKRWEQKRLREAAGQETSVWPTPAGITVLPEITVSPEALKKHATILINNLPPRESKLLEKILENFYKNGPELPDEDL